MGPMCADADAADALLIADRPGAARFDRVRHLVDEPWVPQVAGDSEQRDALGGEQMPVTKVLPQKVCVGPRVVDLTARVVAPWAPLVDLYVCGAPVVEPARHGVPRQSQATVDLSEWHALGMHFESGKTQVTRVHEEIIAGGYDNSCAPGGIRTHTVWCLRPSSLPVGIQGPANSSPASWPRHDELPTAYLLRLGRRYPHTGVSRLRECWG